jgi:signal transduction histidine kinase/ligand-binding sensor domain-containing protein
MLRVITGTGLMENVPGMPRRRGLLECLVFVLFFSLTLPCALALDPSTPLSQAGHRTWQVQDALFSGMPLAMTRTTDGYLWIATTSGLMRFDGIRFTPWEQATGQPAITAGIINLRGVSDGSLWIGTARSLLHWDGNTLTNYSDHTGNIFSIMEARDKTIWIGRGHAGDNDGPLCQVLANLLHCYGASAGIHSSFISEMTQEPNGEFLLGTINSIIQWTPHSSRPITNHHKEIEGIGVAGLIPTAGGDVWVAFGNTGRGRGLQLFRDGEFRKPSITGLAPETLKILSIFKDSHGAIWCGTVNSGVIRIYQGRAEYYAHANGLSGNSIQSITEDHEGNIWIATSMGIDEFRDLSFKPVYTGESDTDVLDAALPLHDGTVLFKTNGKLFALCDGHSRMVPNPPGETVTSMFEDSEDRLWLGYDDKLYLHSKSNFAPVKLQGSPSLGDIVELAESKDGLLWAIAATPEHRSLYRISARTLQATLVSLPAEPYALAGNSTNGLWIALRNGDVLYRTGTTMKTIARSTTGEWATDIAVTLDGTIFATTQTGLTILKNGNYLPVIVPPDLSCGFRYWLEVDRHGNLWVTSMCGVGKYSVGAIHAIESGSNIPVAPQFFDLHDGAQPTGFVSRDLSFGPDGRVWLTSQGGLSFLDLAHLPQNLFPPPVHIEGLMADGKRYSVEGSLRIPARTRDLQIDYTALSYVVPQKVQFRYCLEGRDRDWQDPGNRRQAFYTDLPPGQYRFHVIASNNDGVWNTIGATLEFFILPAFYQTMWFQIVWGVAAAGLIWLLYSIRLRQVTANIKARLGERLNERERIARELHDTLLQDFHAVILHFQAASRHLEKGNPTRTIFEQGLDYADEVLVQGRDRIHDLRSDTTSDDELSESLARYGNELAQGWTMSFSIRKAGTEYHLDPILRDEIYRIGREALGNAFKHSKGSRVEAQIIYEPGAFKMRIHDNGDGIDPEVLLHGRPGHWGLSGMRERAEKVGATLSIWSRPMGGTELELVLPVRRSDQRESWWQRWKWIKRGTNEGESK